MGDVSHAEYATIFLAEMEVARPKDSTAPKRQKVEQGQAVASSPDRACLGNAEPEVQVNFLVAGRYSHFYAGICVKD